MRGHGTGRTGWRRDAEGQATRGVVHCDMALTPRQERFVQEYLLDSNATAAARRAGYSGKTANQIGPRLLVNIGVRAAIDARRAELAQRSEVTQERVVAEYARLAFSDPRAVMDWGPDGVTLKPSGELSDDAAAMVAEVGETRTKDGGSVKIKLHDKARALSDLAKHLGLFTTRIEHTGPDGTPLIPLEALRLAIDAADAEDAT